MKVINLKVPCFDLLHSDSMVWIKFKISLDHNPHFQGR